MAKTRSSPRKSAKKANSKKKEETTNTSVSQLTPRRKMIINDFLDETNAGPRKFGKPGGRVWANELKGRLQTRQYDVTIKNVMEWLDNPLFADRLLRLQQNGIQNSSSDPEQAPADTTCASPPPELEMVLQDTSVSQSAAGNGTAAVAGNADVPAAPMMAAPVQMGVENSLEKKLEDFVASHLDPFEQLAKCVVNCVNVFKRGSKVNKERLDSVEQRVVAMTAQGSNDKEQQGQNEDQRSDNRQPEVVHLPPGEGPQPKDVHQLQGEGLQQRPKFPSRSQSFGQVANISFNRNIVEVEMKPNLGSDKILTLRPNGWTVEVVPEY